MSDKPRYSRISDILDLAIFMSSKIQGVTITEIEKLPKDTMFQEEQLSVCATV